MISSTAETWSHCADTFLPKAFQVRNLALVTVTLLTLSRITSFFMSLISCMSASSLCSNVLAMIGTPPPWAVFKLLYHVSVDEIATLPSVARNDEESFRYPSRDGSYQWRNLRI
jgi:hypothetical protein